MPTSVWKIIKMLILVWKRNFFDILKQIIAKVIVCNLAIIDFYFLETFIAVAFGSPNSVLEGQTYVIGKLLLGNP